jgi:mannose-6-phosphate isomerase-like protein (cupin superfamily)
MWRTLSRAGGRQNPKELGWSIAGRRESLRRMNTASTHQAARPVVCRAGEGEHVWQQNACVTVKLAASECGHGRVSAVEFLAPPAFGPPLHIHHREDEILQIVEGDVRVVCGDTDVVAEPGSFAFLPRGVAHTFRVVGDRPARMLAIFTPGGVEGMFVDAGVPADAARLPDPEATTAVADLEVARHRIEMVGPPLDG